jgi:RNA polymerase primary sigma factor
LKKEIEPTMIELQELEVELPFSDEGVNITDPLSIFLKEIGKVELLTREEEIELSNKISMARGSTDDQVIQMGKAARERFIIANLRLVVSIAKRYSYQNVPLMDLIQDGSMGLIKAVDRYQVEKGFKFSTYATWWIRQSISRSIANYSRTIRIPVHVQDKISRVKKMIREYIIEHGKEPDLHTISDETEIPIAMLKLILFWDGYVISLDEPIGDGESTLGDMTEDTNHPNPESYHKTQIIEDFVNEIIELLSEREQLVIRMRFGFDSEKKTFDEIGNSMGISRERVRQLEMKALKKLRKHLITLNY